LLVKVLHFQIQISKPSRQLYWDHQWLLKNGKC